MQCVPRTLAEQREPRAIMQNARRILHNWLLYEMFTYNTPKTVQHQLPTPPKTTHAQTSGVSINPTPRPSPFRGRIKGWVLVFFKILSFQPGLD